MSHRKSVTAIILIIIISFAVSFSILAEKTISSEHYIQLAQGTKSSGNEVMKEIENGRDFKGMSKEEVIEAIGEPWRKDTTPEKARYDEKWIYSCETQMGLTYDCVFLYFMGGRVIKADVL